MLKYNIYLYKCIHNGVVYDVNAADTKVCYSQMEESIPSIYCYQDNEKSLLMSFKQLRCVFNYLLK